ncbi:CRISPR-associated endonuclease Cas1 [Enemella evansiae]|uniref:CRISPR-associated endonuclease Cas1 n=1 Tax=Enemella evansiae TaxID=2016499 RepID=UPI001E28A3E2|nr:CRISPR-associated endonuclease Cas1 [Enemella evansiae]
MEVCLPDERRLKVVRRRIKVADPDSQVVYLSTPGSLASIRKGRLRVAKGGEPLGDVPIERVQGVQVLGNVDLSSGLIRELLWRDLPVVWTSSSGRVVGWAISARSPNGGPRVQSRSVPSGIAIQITRQTIHGKIANQGTRMRRALRDADAVTGLRQAQERALSATESGQLFGIEGEAATEYFNLWHRILPTNWQWPGRRTRGATDRINAALNFLYALLCGDAIRALALCGLDPHAGLLHSSSRNKPALALDLMEEFRAPVADSVLLDAISRKKLSLTDFHWMRRSVRLSDTCRKTLIRSYEGRMTTEMRHPVFGYQLTWRRAMEVQARQLLGLIDGTQPRYQAIKVR